MLDFVRWGDVNSKFVRQSPHLRSRYSSIEKNVSLSAPAVAEVLPPATALNIHLLASRLILRKLIFHTRLRQKQRWIAFSEDDEK